MSETDSIHSGPPQDPASLLHFESVLAELRDQETSAGDGDSAASPRESEAVAVSDPVVRSNDQVIQTLDELQTAVEQERQDPSRQSTSWAITQAILQDSPNAVTVLRGTRLYTCNLAAARLYGLNLSQDRNQHFFRLLRRGFRLHRKWLSEVVRQLRQGKILEQEVRASRGRNTEWFEIQLKTLTVEGEEFELLTARDISRRKQYELELARSRDFLTHTINAVPEPLSVKSADLKLVLVNDAFCKVYGVEPEQVMGRTSGEVLKQDHSVEIALHEKQVLQTGEQQAAFETFVNQDHEQFILSTYRSAFEDQSNGLPYLVAVSRDVTTEMKRENRLQLLASVFENAQEGVAILNREGAICEANPEFIATVGKSHAKILGTSLEEVVDCEPVQFSEIVELARSGRPWFGYVKMINKRSKEIACWLSLSPSKNRQGETTNLIAMFSDITQIEDTRRELHRQALHDNLTDLPNRRYYRQQISDLIDNDTEGNVRFGVSFLDLDDFKIVNDTLGHDAGDQLLVEVSRRVKESLGPYCFMARFGGDEFALLIPEQVGKPLQAHACAEAVVQSLSQPFNLAGHEVHIGVSVGTTIYPDHATDVESLMRHADVAMYKAKEEGKNKVTFFSSELVEIVENRQRLLSELRTALDQDQLNVVYQPKLCLHTDQVTSCEALVRWTKTDGTVVSPNEFIPLAEDFGLINRLGHMVIDTVCQQARQWHDAGILKGPIAINLSPRQLKEHNFFEQLVETINRHGVDPTWLEFEITENAVMEDVERALNLMHRLDRLGMSIAMDDFGTGYSSLSYIRDFPIRTLKIDTTFVRDLPTCSRAVAIAQTVLSLGHGLDLKVVAEGVETIKQLEFLKASGCDMVQGYLVNRPMTGEEYLAWLETLPD